MTAESLTLATPLIRWQGERGTYHLISITGAEAETIATHARLHRLEYGKGRGFGSVKVMARIGETRWKSSVFPQNQQSEWILLVSAKVRKTEGIEAGNNISVELELL